MQELDNNVYAVILSGGSGTRFWPKSRQKSPKQLCKIGDNAQTMLELTLSRLDSFIPPARRIIVTHTEQASATRAIVGDRAAIVLEEPEARNTANAIALAALEIRTLHKGNKPAVMVSLHADHIIQKIDVFQKAIADGVKTADQDYLTLLGVLPSYPETGYGYIEQGAPLDSAPGYRVQSFREKPERPIAEEYVNSGSFSWNAGIFIWKNDKIIQEIAQRLPDTIASLAQIVEGHPSFTSIDPELLAKTYSQLPKISIDNAVLELSQSVALIKADIGWQDVGSWDALAKCFDVDEKKNFIQGDAITIDTESCTIDTDSLLVATIGLKDMVVACAKGAILVCPKERAQDVKKVVEILKNKDMESFT